MTVVVVGAGPAGLAAAIELRRLGTRDVLVVERDAEPGGAPRHAEHGGYGIRDLRRRLSGPAYARRYAERAAEVGAEIRTDTAVTGWSPDGPLELSGPGGREVIDADAVILATGCGEPPPSRPPVLTEMGGLEMDPVTGGPVVDLCLRTSRNGVFAAGNLLHPGEPADVSALCGRHAAATASEHVRGSAWPERRVAVECDPPLHSISPNAISDKPGTPPRGRFALRSTEPVARPRVAIVQDGRTLWDGRPKRLVPERSTRLPAGWTTDVDAGGGPVRVRLAQRG